MSNDEKMSLGLDISKLQELGKALHDIMSPVVANLSRIAPAMQKVQAASETLCQSFKQSGLAEALRNLASAEIDWDNLFDKMDQQSAEALLKHNWIVSLEMTREMISHLDSIVEGGEDVEAQLTKLYEKIYSYDNCHHLALLVESMNEQAILAERMPVLRESLLILKGSEDKDNATLSLLPALLAQIDGTMSDIVEKVGWRRCTNGKNRGRYIYNDVAEYRNIIIRDRIQVKSRFMSASKRFLCDLLFQPSRRGEELKIDFYFNRHKIMHGEFTNYGRFEYLIRAFMLLDFLGKLSDEVYE